MVNPNDPTGKTGYCAIPSEYGTCTTAVGCQAPYGCVDTSSFLKGGGLQCLQTCTASTDCLSIFDACEEVSKTAAYCLTNICGPESMALSGQANGTAYLAPCNAVGTNDGTCLPAFFTNPADGGPLLGGVCTPNGPAAAGQPCSADRTADAGQPELCAANTTCIGNGTESECFPNCATDENACGGSPCAAGSACLPLEGLDMGVCVVSCTGNSCTAPLACVSSQD